jgi:hypothetical protein
MTPSDEALHDELNDHACRREFTAIHSALRALQKSAAILTAAQADALTSAGRVGRQRQLAAIDQALQQMTQGAAGGLWRAGAVSWRRSTTDASAPQRGAERAPPAAQREDFLADAGDALPHAGQAHRDEPQRPQHIECDVQEMNFEHRSDRGRRRTEFY